MSPLRLWVRRERAVKHERLVLLMALTIDAASVGIDTLDIVLRYAREPRADVHKHGRDCDPTLVQTVDYDVDYDLVVGEARRYGCGVEGEW